MHLLSSDAPKPDKYTRRIARIAITAIVLVGFLVFGYITNRVATSAASGVHGTCQFYRDIGNIAPSDKSTAAGLQIFADARNAYAAAGCELGPLNPPDPRLLPYLKH